MNYTIKLYPTFKKQFKHLFKRYKSLKSYSSQTKRLSHRPVIQQKDLPLPPNKKQKMKPQRHAAYLLLLLSILMLGVPVIPHHHHADGVLCMKNDVQAGCCTPAPDEAEGHCCCDTGCPAAHFFQQRPDAGPDIPLPLSNDILFLPTELLALLISHSPGQSTTTPFYIESLHDTLFTRATGLRAPPAYSL